MGTEDSWKNLRGRVDGVHNKLLDAVEADVEAALQDGGGVVGHEGVDVGGGVPAVRAGLVLSLDRSAAAAAAVGGGQSWPSRPRFHGAPCGSREWWQARRRGYRGRVLPGLALRAAAGSCGGGWRIVGRCPGGEAGGSRRLGGCLGGVGGVAASNRPTRALSLGFVTI